jgi:hypothetical protein
MGRGHWLRNVLLGISFIRLFHPPVSRELLKDVPEDEDALLQDWQKLSEDWYKVGDDLRAVMGKLPKK